MEPSRTRNRNATKRRAGVVWLLASLCWCYPLLASRPATGSWEVPFSVERGHFIVVGGAVLGEAVRLMVDTGATHSVIDRRLVRRLGLRTVARPAAVSAYRLSRTAPWVRVHGLRVGPAVTSLTGPVADLSWAGVDIIVGLDLLRDRAHLANPDSGEILKEKGLAIDFENKTLSFRVPPTLEHSQRIVSGKGQVIVPVQVDGRRFCVAIDSGARRLNLFRPRRDAWASRLKKVRTFRIQFLGSIRMVTGRAVKRMQLGSTVWADQMAAVHEVDPGDTDGVLGLVSLGLKRVHFDFEQQVVSWMR